MKKRTKLADRILPDYCKGEEIMNTVTHIAGGGIAIAVLVLCVIRAAINGTALAIVGCSIYGFSMVALYTVSSVYHGLKRSKAKKVMQVIDHCTIYILIAGTYTAVLTCGIIPIDPVMGWSLLGAQWLLGCGAAALTAIDLNKYRYVSMTMYICMGWSVVICIPQVLQAMSGPGFGFLLAGGIAYTLGAVLYGIGNKKAWFHSVFHIFVVLGSGLQFIAIYCYGI